MTPEECLEKAKEVEKLARETSATPEKQTLFEMAMHWRLLASSTNGADTLLKGSPHVAADRAESKG